MQLMRNPEAAKMRVRFYKVRPMAPFLDVNVQDSRLRHRRRVVFVARDVLLLTVELCKVELCPMLVPFVVWSSLQTVGSKSCVEVLERLRRLRNFSLHVGCLRKSKKF